MQTPHLDALAARGTRFQNAYTNCPFCVPSRASLATGRYVHQIGYWDNGPPYDGTPVSWHQRLREQGFCCDSIGKLHFKGQDADHGFSEEIEPLHVVDGVGDVLGCIRDQPPFRDKHGELGRAGRGRFDLFAVRRPLHRTRLALARRTPRRCQALGRLPQLRLPASALYRPAGNLRPIPARRRAAATAVGTRCVARPSGDGLLPPLLPL